MLKQLFALAICFGSVGWAASKPDFSGNYAQLNKGDSSSSVSIRVVETDAAVEVTRVYGAKSITNKFPLDGSQGDYVTEAGVHGTCRAKLKNDVLVLEYLVASRPYANEPALRFDTTEEWRLSSDTRTLTIKTEIKCPDMPANITAAAFPNNPQKEKFQRLDSR